ncbi:MAG: hypothetical protein PWQ93_884 [Clostridiales bacterium]|nr:hypothetical protein [Clostridiales bacterium]
MKNIKWLAIAIGIIMIIASIIVFANPTATIRVIALLVGIAVIVSGVVSLVENIRHEQNNITTFHLILSVLVIIFGIILVSQPDFAINVFVYIIGIWFIIDAIRRIIDARGYKTAAPNLYTATVVMAVLLLIVGALLLLNPYIAWFTVEIIIGISLLIGGIVHLVYGVISRSDL